MLNKVLYISSGRPSPVIVNLCNELNYNDNLTLLYLDRPHVDLKLDSSSSLFKTIKINVNYSSGFLKRLLIFPILVFKILSISKKSSINKVICESYDNLIIAIIYKKLLKRDTQICFYCRDLIKFQYEKNLISYCFRIIEKHLLGQVDFLMSTSVKFYTSYYNNYFNNFYLYENIPIIDIKTHKSNSSIFRISFIGIIRYVDVIKNLIQVIEEVSKKGILVELNFYGGGNDKDISYLKRQITNKKLFHFHGPFSYSTDINNIYSNTDLSIALYNPADFNCQLAIPNKYYESILSNTPIATSKGTYLSEIVKRKKIGASIDPNNSDEITRFLVNTIKNNDSWYSNCIKNLKTTNIDIETNINKATLKHLKQDDWIN